MIIIYSFFRSKLLGEFSEPVLCSGGVFLFGGQLFLSLFQCFLQSRERVALLTGQLPGVLRDAGLVAEHLDQSLCLAEAHAAHRG